MPEPNDFVREFWRIGQAELEGLAQEIQQGRLGQDGKDPTVEEIVTWCETEIGIRLRSVPKVLDVLTYVVDQFRARKIARLAVLGPRGGGKTMMTAVIQLVAYRFFGFSWQNVGGSLEQARRCYQYVRDAHLSSRDLNAFTRYTQASDTRSKYGGSISVSAASHTSIRGAHPVGPSGGGGLTLDEAAIIPDSICDAAKGQLSSANPSALIQLSTMGEKPQGRFWELIQAPAAKGYELKSYTIFDVAKRCSYDCETTCPVKEHFAEDFHDVVAGKRQMVHRAYCGGAAHQVDGWVSIDEIAQQWRELGRAAFEREMMGMATHTVGAVYDPRTIDAAQSKGKRLSADPDQHLERFKRCEKFVGIDWGFAGECALAYGLRLRETVVVYRWEFFTHERFSVIRDHLIARCFEEKIDRILADSANPSDNEELSNLATQRAQDRGLDWVPRVSPVVFSTWKAYGIGEVRRRLEKGQIKFVPDFIGPADPSHERAMKYLKNYHTDDQGQPIKKDDHACDALLCLCLGWSQSFQTSAKILGGRA